MKRAATLLLATVLLTTGCVNMNGLPRLSSSVDQGTMEWGEAIQITVYNEGESPYPAPLTVEIRDNDGETVRTFEDITGDRGIPVNGQITFSWNGYNDQGNPIMWGTYTVHIGNDQIREPVQILKPDNYAITVDPIPEETQTGSPMTFAVNNTGNVWLNGTLTVMAGKNYDDQDDKEDVKLYENTVEGVQLAPDGTYELHWQGHTPDGEEPEPDKYLVGAMMELESGGPTPMAQDVFELTER